MLGLLVEVLQRNVVCKHSVLFTLQVVSPMGCLDSEHNSKQLFLMDRIVTFSTVELTR